MSKKEKKLTVKAFEHKKLAEVNFAGKSYRKVYSRITYERRTTEIPSPTFKHLIDNWFDEEFEIHEIETEDSRIFQSLRNYVESKGQPFSVDLLSKESYQKELVFVGDILTKKVHSSLVDFLWAARLGATSNLVKRIASFPPHDILHSIEELNPSVAKSIHSQLSELLSLWTFFDVFWSTEQGERLTIVDLRDAEKFSEISEYIRGFDSFPDSYQVYISKLKRLSVTSFETLAEEILK